MTMGKVPNIVLLGGAGDVGLRLAQMLHQQTEAFVTTVSRRVADNNGQQNSRRRHISYDLTGPETLKIAAGAIVINLTEATPPSMVKQVIEGSGWFLETSATPKYLQEIMNSAESAAGSGSAVMCVGVAPGLTNLMATKITTDAPNTRQVDIGLEMGMGRHYGAAATEWFLSTAGRPYDIVIDHVPRRVAAGDLKRKFIFRQDGQSRLAVGYGFAEQSLIAEQSNLSLKTVRSFVALDPSWMTRMLLLMQSIGLGSAISRNAAMLAKWLLRFPAFGATQTRLVVEGFDDAGGLTGQIRVVTGDQAQATAAMIFATIESVLVRQEPMDEGLTMITDHLQFDEAMAALRRFLPETVLSIRFGVEPQ